MVMAGGVGFFGRVSRVMRRPSQAQPEARESADRTVSSFGVLGERGEALGEQLAFFCRRIEDVVRLREEFSLVEKPMLEFVASHAATQTRLSEVMALLARERNDTRGLRLEVGDLRKQVAEQESLLAGAQSQLQALEDAAVARDVDLKRAQVAAADLTARLDWANHEIAAQADVVRDKDAAYRGLIEERARLEKALAEATALATQLRDRTGGQDAEIIRLSHLVDQLQPQLASAKRRIADLGADLHSASLTISSQEFKIAGEQEARRKAEAALAESIAAADTEIAQLKNEIASLKTKHDATQRLFEQSRDLVVEKTEAARLSDRAAKEALSEKASLERRLAAALEEARHLKDKIDLSVRGAEEARERAVMLSGAIAARTGKSSSFKIGSKRSLPSYKRRLLASIASERISRQTTAG